MTAKTETAPLHPQALKFAREKKELSMRELCRRVAARMSKTEQQHALQVRLGRLEKGDHVSEEDRELLDALAMELAVGVGDLAEPPVWVWIRLYGARPGIVELALRMPCWTSPEKAKAARDWLALTTEGDITPFVDAYMVPMRFHALAQDVLDANFPDLSERERRLLLVVDPPLEDVLVDLALLNAVLNQGFRDEEGLDLLVADFDQHGLFGELSELHDLSLRRLELAPAEYPALVESWRLREERLWMIIERRFEKRQAERQQVRADKELASG